MTTLHLNNLSLLSFELELVDYLAYDDVTLKVVIKTPHLAHGSNYSCRAML